MALPLILLYCLLTVSPEIQADTRSGIEKTWYVYTMKCHSAIRDEIGSSGEMGMDLESVIKSSRRRKIL